MRTRNVCVSGVRNLTFSENFANLQNEWFPNINDTAFLRKQLTGFIFGENAADKKKQPFFLLMTCYFSLKHNITIGVFCP